MDKPICKYHSYETFPAKVFFEIRETGNYQLMRPKPNTDTTVLANMYADIYDIYFLKTDNKDAARYLELRNIVTAIPIKVKMIKNVLKYIWETPSNLWDEVDIKKLRIEVIEAINKLLDTPIDIENDFIEELSRVLNVELGIMENDIAEAEMELETIVAASSKSVFDFYESLGNISDAHGRTLDEKILLPMYVAEERRAVKKADAQRLKNMAV